MRVILSAALLCFLCATPDLDTFILPNCVGYSGPYISVPRGDCLDGGSLCEFVHPTEPRFRLHLYAPANPGAKRNLVPPNYWLYEPFPLAEETVPPGPLRVRVRFAGVHSGCYERWNRNTGEYDLVCEERLTILKVIELEPASASECPKDVVIHGAHG